MGSLVDMIRYYQTSKDGLPTLLGRFISPNGSDDDDEDLDF